VTDQWSLVAAERGAIADDVAGLRPEQWATATLCPSWTVRDVVAHMTATGSLNPGTFLVRFATTGFNFEKFVNGEIRKHLGSDSGATLAAFRAVQNSTSAPPGPKASWLGEVVVHSEDIRRPLGISHAYDPAAIRQAADFYKGSNTLIGTKNRIAGLTLKATDQDWSHGQGPVVEGPLLSLLMAMTGRSAHIIDLAGDGVETLRSRTS